MTQVIRELFSKFPRSVGNPRQHMVHSWDEFEDYIAFNNGKNNIYSTTSYYSMSGVPITDKVYLDFDSQMKESAFPDTTFEGDKIEQMRENEDLAEEVLGEPLKDARKVCRWAEEQSIPCVSVFTGLGFHVSLLFQPEVEPEEKITSTAVMLEQELDIGTLDDVPLGNVHALMRIPNCERVDEGRRCNHFTIPLTSDEMCDINIHEMLDISHNPRWIEVDSKRPDMKNYPSYTQSREKAVEPDPVSEPVEIEEEGLEQFVKNILQLPCMYERFLQPSPDHIVRQNAAVLFFNCGMKPKEVKNIYAKMGWSNYDEEKTMYYLNYAYEKKYADMSCRSLIGDSKCVFEEDERKEKCPTHGWSGGTQEY